MSTVKFPKAISAVTLANGQAIDGATGRLLESAWQQPPTGHQPREIDISWYQEQRQKLAAVETQAARVNETLALGWYKIVRRSLADLPIQQGGRSIINPDYGANMRTIALALGMSPRTLSGYRTAVSRIRDETHFRELIKGTTWTQVVWALNVSPAHHVDGKGAGGLPPVKRRLLVQVPTATTDFLMENGLAAPDVTAAVVSYLRQPKVQRDLLKLFRLSAEQAS